MLLRKKLLIIGGLLLLLPACYKKSPSSGQPSIISPSTLPIDLPHPLGAQYQLLAGACDSPEICLKVSHTLPVHRCIEWLQTEMERLGWSKVSHLTGENHAVLVYKKPLCLCTLHIPLTGTSILMTRVCTELA